MSTPQVGQGAVAIIPTFKGFRRGIETETDGSAKAASSGFKRIFASTGTQSGRETGRGFKRAFDSEATGFTAKATRELEQAVAKSAREVSAARLKEQDAAGKVRLAEAQLAEARQRYASDSSQVIRAEERLATASRQVETAHQRTEDATKELRTAQSRLADSANDSGNRFVNAWRRASDGASGIFRSVFAGSFFGTSLANIATGVGARIGRSFVDGFRQTVEFGLGTIDIASDLNESVNAVQVSYGPIADAILGLGDTSAQTFGLSRRDLNAYSVQFSAFAKSIAGEGGDVAGTFESILGRATDFASVMNLEVSEALGLFQSGLAGETEPLRRYGIDLSAASVQAYAYATGIAESGKELTEAQKQQARYSYLLEQTSGVQGDFANTSDELANKNRINAATWDDLQAKIGQGFLPIAGALATVLADDVFPEISKLVDEYGPEMATAFQSAVPSLRELAREVLPQIPGLIESVADSLPLIVEGITTVVPPLIDFIGKLVNGAQQISDFFTTSNERLSNGAAQWGEFFGAFGGWWDGTIAKFTNGGEQIGGFFSAVGGMLANGANQFGSFFSGIGSALANGAQQIGSFAGTVGTKITEAVGFVASLPGRALEALSGIGQLLLSSGRALIQGFIDGIGQMFRPVADAVGGILEFVGGFFPNSPAKRGPLSGSGWTRIGRSGVALMDQFEAGMRAARIAVPFDSLDPAQTGGRISAGLTGGGGATVNQYITTQQTDPRVQARQWAREAQREFAAS
ncbi:hypothetical protein ACIGCK_04760 [Microbacterium sp. NPDC078428]|uniref:hypothetical protein n=1 Tax=Microbacterium sp. NPDC078428 TaxID=3364190 RepID=UPI0037C8A4A1